MLGKAILTSRLLYSAEAWSAVSENEITRLEQVDSSLIKGLVNGHSNTIYISLFRNRISVAITHFENKQMMYNYHLLNLGDEETMELFFNEKK